METQQSTFDNARMRAEEVHEESTRFQLLAQEISHIIVGNQETVQALLIAILSKGHVLLEGLPGVAKTTMVNALAQGLGLDFKRIQFTPDLLPSDIIGTLMYNQKVHDFEVKKGPIFTNIVLADEINRAPAKVQSALLECMQEKQVTLGNETFKLDEPFLVFATQNPIEQEGTYTLPEAQVDRFMFKLTIGYPTQQQEKQIIQLKREVRHIKAVLTKADISRASELLKTMYVDEKIIDYIISLVCATRNPELFGLRKFAPYIKYGASPRATQNLFNAAIAFAFLKKRYFVLPDDVKAVCSWVLRHRIALQYQAQMDGIRVDDIIAEMLTIIPAP